MQVFFAVVDVQMNSSMLEVCVCKLSLLWPMSDELKYVGSVGMEVFVAVADVHMNSSMLEVCVCKCSLL